MAWLKQDEKYVILNIANEWGPWDYTWAQGYESAIARLRAAGINCLLMIDASSGAQFSGNILTWGQQILDSDPQHNVVFSIHMYGNWVTEQSDNIVGIYNGVQPYDMLTALQTVAAADLPLVVGEFSSDSTSSVNYSTQRAMQIFQSLDLGWIAWSWNGNAEAAADMVVTPGYQYNSDADLRPFGNLIINDPNDGLKATSLRASIFPPGVAVEPDSNMQTTQAGGTAQFTVSLDSPPVADVTIPLSSSDTTQGTVSPASLTFTSADWNVPQIVTVTGVDNGIAGGNTAYTIVTGPTVSQDPAYNGLNPSGVSLTNINTDGPVQIVAGGGAGWSEVGPWLPSGPGARLPGGAQPLCPGRHRRQHRHLVLPRRAGPLPDRVHLDRRHQSGRQRPVHDPEQWGPDRHAAGQPEDGAERHHGRRSQLDGPGQLPRQRRDPAGAALRRRRRHRHRRRRADRKPDEYQYPRGRHGLAAAVLESGTTGLVYTFTRTGALDGPLTVAFGVGGTAIFGIDYTESGADTFGATSGTVTFAAGSATATVTLNPIADGVADGDETAVLTLAAGTGYAIDLPSSAFGTISDAQVSVAASPASVPEDGSSGLVYTFTRTGSLVGPLTVSFGVGGTAAFGSDYTQSGALTFGAKSGTITIPAGSATATVTLNPIADTQPDPDETAILTVSYATGYDPVSPRAATGTFTDNHVFVEMACYPSWVAKDGPNQLVYTFNRAGSTAGPLTVAFTVGGTAVLGTDYTESGADTFGATSGTVTIPDGSASASVSLSPIADNPLEPNETAILTVSGSSGYTVGSNSQASGVITDTTSTVSVTASPAAVPEGGSATLTYTFTRAGSLAGPLTVPFAVGGTAVYGTDYTETGAASFTATAGTITFAAASATASVIISSKPGDLAKPNTTVIFTLSPGIGLLVGSSGSASGTIASKQDTTTQGNWIANYGASGYDIVSGPTSLPAGDTVTPTGASTFTWTTTSTDPRALQVPGSPNRVAAVWYSATSFSVDVNLGDGVAHDLELYLLDWTNSGRAETVQITDATTGAVLSNVAVRSFQSGEYLDYAVSGHIKITITNIGPANALLNGLFLNPTAAATAVKQDTTTQGTWIGTYGASGYDIVSRRDQPPRRRHGQAHRADGLQLEHRHHRPPRLAGPRLA